jgi:nucleotide-binding universal stress UspA family protein
MIDFNRMIDFKRILFPVDFSVQSIAAVPFVTAMARLFRSEVTALHVIHMPPAWTQSPAFDADRSRTEGKAALDQFVARNFEGTSVILELAEGDVAHQIVTYAHDHNVDLIMMPTHGHGPFRALLLGSVTAKVLHDVRCPVWTGVHAEEMTSRSPGRPLNHPLNQWRRALCAVDTDVDTEGGPDLLMWASELSRGQNLELRLVHVVAGADGMWTEEDGPGMYEFLFNAARRQLEKLQAAAGTNLEVRLIGGSVGGAVHKAALESDADVIVIGRGAIRKGLGRLRSSAYSIIREAPCPVISI